MGSRHTVFIPSDHAGSRKDTAILLVGTAREFGVSQQDIASARTGFYITQHLADILEQETAEPEAEESTTTTEPKKAKSPKKTSGNRAAKTTG